MSNFRDYTYPTKSLKELLAKKTHWQSNKLRQRLLQDGVKSKLCESCKLFVWNDQPIPLELDHIDGDKTNNELNNLRMLCPNCHAQTDHYRGRNMRKYKERMPE